MGAKTYLNFDLLIDHSDQGYVARVLDAPAGTTKNRFNLPFSDLELENLYLRVGRSRRMTRRLESPEAEAIKNFGGRLYDAVFGGTVGSALRSSVTQACVFACTSPKRLSWPTCPGNTCTIQGSIASLCSAETRPLYAIWSSRKSSSP